MKSYLYLTKKYIKSYPKRCINIVLCISLFVFAFLTILWFSESFKYSLVENYRIENGSYEVVLFDADENDVKEKENELLNEGAGIINGLWEVDSSRDDISIGDAKENVSEILSLHFLSGEMPKSENEVAIEKSTYDILNLNSEIGDTVEFTVKNSDGSSEKKSFVLTGIIENFSDKIKSQMEWNNYQTLGDVSIPSIFTVNTNITPSYIHIFSKVDSFLIRNVTSEATYFANSKEELASVSIINRIILLPIQLFFVLATIMGVLTVSIYFFKEQEQYLNMLRCVGFSKRKSRRLLLIQGLLLWISSLFVAVVGSILVLLLLQLISSFSSQPLFLNLTPISLIFAALLEGIVIFITFNVLLHRFYRNAPLREAIYTPKKSRKSYTNIKRCWHKAYGRKYRLQNISCIMIIFFCVGMSIFGSFIPMFNAKGTSFKNPDHFPDNSDYSLRMGGGGMAMESYYINFPVGVGVSHDMANEITSDNRVKVLEASISHLCIPFFLTTQNPENKLMYKYTVEAKQDGGNFEFKHKRTDEMIKLAGGDSSKESLVELPVIWHSYDSILNNINTFSNGEIDEKGYKSGIEVIAPDDLCSVGDEFTMVIPIPDKNATEKNIDDHIRFEVAKIKVAATYSKEQYDSDRLIISTEYIFSIYPDLNYESLILENLDHNDQIWTQKLEQNLETLKAASTGIKYNNYALMSKEFYDQVNLETLEVVVSIIMFVIIIIIAIIFSSYIQVRSNLKSYVIMRAIGAKIETVQKLIINEINHTLIIGIVLGVVCGWALVIFFSVIASNMKLWDIYLFYILPVFIVTVILLYFGSHIAVKRAVHSIINENIVEKLNTVE